MTVPKAMAITASGDRCETSVGIVNAANGFVLNKVESRVFFFQE